MSRRAGRPPKPVELKLIEGNRGKRRLEEPPKAAPGRPTAPSWLTDYAKAEWRYLVPILDELGLLTRADRAVLATYCEAFAVFRAATEGLGDAIAEGKLMVKSGNRLSKHPLLQVQRDARRDVLAHSAALGISPVDRVRLLGAARPPATTSGLDEVIGR
jgi:P27 family predicted phage terminase small subunit